MEPRRPLSGQRLEVLETVRFLRGEADEVEQALTEYRPDVVALDLPPARLRETVAHVKHGLGVTVGRLDEVWTNVLAAAAPVEPYGEHAAAVRWALAHGATLVALDRKGRELRAGQKTKLERSLDEDPLDATDLRELAMAFRGRLYELGLLSTVEKGEEEMAKVLWDVLTEGVEEDEAPPGALAALLHYPASEEVAVRLREKDELKRAADRVADDVVRAEEDEDEEEDAVAATPEDGEGTG